MERFYNREEIKKGYNKIVGRGERFKFIDEFGILRLGDGDSFSETSPECETALIILKGSCSVTAGNITFEDIHGRETIFSGLTNSVYIPPGINYSVTGRGVEIGVCKALCRPYDGEAELITPDRVKVMQVGSDNWSREVRIMIGPNTAGKNMIVGETVNPPGNWSGTPPHKHEKDSLPEESLHEELYYFRTDKPQGWGIERFYSPERNINDLIYLQDNIVTYMPWGYHQIVAGPGYTLYYLFFLAGKGNTLTGYEDPDHNWIKKVEGGS